MTIIKSAVFTVNFDQLMVSDWRSFASQMKTFGFLICLGSEMHCSVEQTRTIWYGSSQNKILKSTI